ncbi:DNA repair protein rad10 [Kalmanozyma brasiliensis GHG001]|uniref:DNA excision repair protein ERCC-1 n=1 Tax=Kalmanozyma brasiliensis (strain GHG001) TaxID=1365824 RepID=V5E8Z6_KALBG|nr:DNA repair protein rad10 [Kalmanozyma brasiliensis GHG001]EST06816.1 DNA repair protein rad10 [Kalmanozyma brasiliensis GHG001]
MNSTTTNPSTGAGSVVQPRPRPLIRGAAGTGNTILVNNCQRGNPLLQHIRNIGWEYADIVPDYQVGLSSCILFLSIRYHRLHPEYVHTRIQKLGNMFTLRILLVLCDVNDHQAAIKELTKTGIINNLTLIIAWTAEEAGKYVETYKSFEHKPPDLIKERVGEDYLSQVTNVLTQVRGVNRTDVVTLLTRFGSLKGVVGGGVEEVGMCPGFGEVKAKRLREVFTQPFRVGEGRTYKQRKMGSNQPNNSAITENAARGGLPEDILTTTTTTTRTRTPQARTAESGSTAESGAPAQPARALDALEQDFDNLSEQEQLRLAMQLSVNADEPPSP